MTVLDAESLLEGLDDAQREAALALAGPVCILAGAGSGKTRTIVHRTAYGVATGAFEPSKVLALTFTTKAAGELRMRLRGLGAGQVQVRTFHSAALAQLNHFWPKVVGGRMPRIVESKAQTVADAARAIGLTLDVASLRDLAAEIEWRKANAMTLERYAELAPGRTLPPRVTPTQASDLHLSYERLMDDRAQIDFEDVLLACTGMLERERQVSDEVHRAYRFFVVDEYQDVSPAQRGLLAQWLGDRRDLCVVGDASQTIYSFAGASATFLTGFGHEFPGATVVELDRSYRSSPEIVAVANALVRDEVGAIELVAETDHGPVPEVRQHSTDVDEAEGVAERVAALIAAGTAPRDIAVLTRINAQGLVIERALGERGIPVLVRGGTPFFQIPEVQKSMLAVHAAPADGRPLFQIMSEIVREHGWTEEPPAGPGAVRERWDALHALVDLAERSAAQTPRAFAAELAALREVSMEPPREAVTVATLHSAKGLEWDAVFVIGLTEGLLPISYATTDAHIAEERRLLYVGVTRARRSLTLSYATGVGRDRRAPSRFLAQLRSRTAGGDRSSR